MFDKPTHEILNRQERINDVRETRKSKIQIWQPSLLDEGILCFNSKIEATIKKYVQDQEKEDIAIDKLSVKEICGPI